MDFYDKLFISITFIIVTIVAIFNTFCFAYSSVDVVRTDDLFFNIYDYNFQSGNRNGFYFETIPGNRYQVNLTFNVSPNYITASCSQQPSVGVTGSLLINDNVEGTSYTHEFVATDNYYFCYIGGTSTTDFLSIQVFDTTSNGMYDSVTALVDGVGPSNLWGTFESSIPYIGVVVLASFGFYWIIHTIKEVSKGKEKMY